MTSRHWLLADASYRADIFMAPVHYQAQDGSWQPIDTALSPSDKPGYAFSNERNVIKAHLPGSDSGWARVEYEDTSVSFRPVGTWDSPAAVNGNRSTYSPVALGTTLSYEVQPGTLKELITLAAPISAPSFSFTMKTEGLTPRANGDGSIDLLDSQGEPVLLFPAPWMKDADGRVSTAISVSLTPVGNDYQYILTPDSAWLAAARYPVVVDPTVTYNLKRTYADRTAVVRKNAATTEYFPGLEYYGSYAGVYPAVGTTTAGDAYRTVVYIGSALPLDSDIDAATLHMEVDHVQYGGSVTLRAYDPHTASVNVSQPGNSNVTWNSIGGTTPPEGVASSPTYFYDFDDPPSSVNFDVTAIVQGWDDRRDDMITATQAIVIRDTSDAGTSPSGARYYFKSQNYSGYAWLSVTYTQGWYGFQGNRRHTGRADQPLSPNLEVKWSLPLTEENRPKHVGASYRYVEPGVLAVPDTISGATVVYAAVGYNQKYWMLGEVHRPYTRVHRVKDLNGVIQGTPLVATIDEFYPTGTPLVIGNTLVMTGITNFVVGYEEYPRHGRVIALNATTLSPLWQRDLPGSTFSSPAYWPGDTTYKDQNGVTRTHTGGCVILAVDNTFIEPWQGERYRGETDGDGISYESYLVALSLQGGKHVWGTAYRTSDANDGNLVPNVMPPDDPEDPNDYVWPFPTLGGLTPFRYSSSYASAPVITNGLAAAMDRSCAANARYLDDGSYAWENQADNAHEESSFTVFRGRLYWGFMHDTVSGIPSDGTGGISSLSTTGGLPWSTSAYWLYPLANPRYSDRAVWGTPVIHPTEWNVLVADLAGRVFGVHDDVDPYTDITPAWSAPDTSISNPAYCSPLMAMEPGTNRWHLFVGADYPVDDPWEEGDPIFGQVHVLQADEEIQGNSRRVSILQDGPDPLSGPIRSSMAAYNGRLWVMSPGNVNPSTSTFFLTSVPTLYCMGPLQ